MTKKHVVFLPLGVGQEEIAKIVEPIHLNWVAKRNGVHPRISDGPSRSYSNAPGSFPAPIKVVDVEVQDRRNTPRRGRSTRGRLRRAVSAALRRVFDVSCAVLGLLMLSPLFLVVIVAIKLEGGGPAFFSQLRVGKGLDKFRILKFRTMYPDASQASLLTAPQDPRVTRVGRYLRKYKVDELPQLVNVVRGEMQLVGVRPQVERFVDAFRREYSVLLQDRPGITDPAAVAYRNEEKMFEPGQMETQYVSRILPTKLRISLKYYEVRNLFSDVEVLVKTILGSKNALSGGELPKVRRKSSAGTSSRSAN